MTTQQGEKNNRGAGKIKKGYRQSFGLLGILAVIGFILEAITTANTTLPTWPVNIIIIAGYIVLTAILYFYFKGPVIRWIVSIPSTVAAVSVMTALVLFMGFIPQEDVPGSLSTQLGLTHVTRSYPYLLIALYLVTVLTFAIYKRAYPLTLKNGAFLLNHAGLWLVIVTASLGTADLKRLNMTLTEGEKKQVAFSGDTPYKVPFSIKLHDFQLEEYNPKMAIYDHATGKPLEAKQTNPIRIQPGMEHQIGPWKLKVEKFLSSAVSKGDKYVESQMRGAAPAALIQVANREKNVAGSRWVTCGTQWMGSKNFTLSRNNTLVMLKPEAKEYASELTIYHQNGQEEDYRLVVNKPYSFNSWKIYQSGYDSKAGKYSRVSVLELVFDPWLEAVYTGIIMMTIGALYLMFFGKRK